VEKIARLRQFIVETWAELKKTTWPSRREVYGTTLVVIVTVLICAAYLFVVDLLLAGGMDWLFEAFGA
jgi:preprotein translocase subunit SecE